MNYNQDGFNQGGYNPGGFNTSFGPTKEEKTFGMLCHLLAFSGLIVPFGTVLGPLVMWLIKKDQSAYVDAQGKEALNFQISMLIYSFISGILIFVIIGILTSIVLGIFWLIVVIIASIRANEGILYRYPLTIRFFK